MAANASLTARLNEIQSILRSGIVRSEVNGQVVVYDHNSLRKEEKELLQKLSPARRPVVSGINLGGFQ